jgi:hypothetical protein
MAYRQQGNIWMEHSRSGYRNRLYLHSLLVRLLIYSKITRYLKPFERVF